MTNFTFYNLIDDVTPRLHLVKYHVIISEYKISNRDQSSWAYISYILF